MIIRIDSRGQCHAITVREGPEREEKYSSTASLTSVLDGCGWSTPGPGRFTFREKDSAHTVQEDGWALEPIWRGAENLALAGIRSLDRPSPPYG